MSNSAVQGGRASPPRPGDARENAGLQILGADPKQRILGSFERVSLVGGVARDFNNMLTVVGSYARMLADGDLARDHRESIDEILRATEGASSTTASGLCSRILDS